MVSLGMDESDGVFRIRIEGEIDITAAVEMKSLLVTALASGREVRVNLQDAADLDVMAIQLLHAAERDAARAGVRFQFEDSIPQALSLSMAEAGFEKFNSKS